MPKKALPPKQAKVDNGHQCFSVVAQAKAKILPRLAQGSCQVKELDRTTKANAEMNADWKVEKAQYAEFNVPTCGKVAVWQLCRERQPLWNSHDSWWTELKMFGSMPWCSFPRQKLLPKLGQKNCHTTTWIWSIGLQYMANRFTHIPKEIKNDKCLARS